MSDPAMEEALHEIPTLRRFAQLGGLDDIPDETTILNFRRLLETHGLAARMLDAVNAHLARKGQSLRSGTIVDATLIAAPSSTKNADHARVARGDACACTPQGMRPPAVQSCVVRRAVRDRAGHGELAVARHAAGDRDSIGAI
ncbi:IS5 family transposase [Xanthomonas arboricola]|nr:IS5 family transposase [Xanthomonas sp. 4461]